MPDHSRIDDLRLRVERDPGSIAFAQLAEEYRRAGQLDQAILTCRAGLAIHPEYTSARVTLGRALLASGRPDDAGAELRLVLAETPHNVAAIRALAETCREQGRLQEALTHARDVLRLAPDYPGAERFVNELELAVADSEQRVQEASRRRATAIQASLERWLEAIDAFRAQRHA